MANSTLPTPADMEVTPERALAIKKALVRQYADQYGLEVSGWEETINGVKHTVILNETQKKVAPA